MRRLDAAARLAAHAPKWLGAALVTQLAAASTPGAARPWVFTLALATPDTLGSFHSHGGRLAWTRLGRWARDARLDADDRCLAATALAATAELDHRRARATREAALQTLHELIRDGAADLRSCAALALSRFAQTSRKTSRRDAHQLDNTLAALLYDQAARVRAAALLGIAVRRTQTTRPLPAPLRGHIALLAHSDPSFAVRKAASGASTARPAKVSEPAPDHVNALLLWDQRTRRHFTNYGWLPATSDEHGELLLPHHDVRGVSWVLLPALNLRPSPILDATVTGGLATLLIEFLTH
jgi:hypothetical protein